MIMVNEHYDYDFNSDRNDNDSGVPLCVRRGPLHPLYPGRQRGHGRRVTQ